jgi:hypothetical protein
MGLETINANSGRVAVIIDEKENSGFSGIVKSFYFNSFARFLSLDELLFAMEDLFDALQYPMQTVKYRLFTNKTSRAIKPKQVYMMEQSEISQMNTDKTTFIINVLYRQNATWQGNIHWVNQNQTMSFRSTNELIKLMESALSKDTEEIVDWDPQGAAETTAGKRE